MASHDVPIGSSQVSLAALNERSREIFRSIVESYLATGEPVGSRNLSRILPISLSPAIPAPAACRRKRVCGSSSML